MFRHQSWVRAILLAAAVDCALYGAVVTGGEPMIVKDGFAFVQAHINGYGPLRLLIDTGSASCLLAPESARKAFLTLDHRMVLASRTGEKIIPGSSGNRVQVGAHSESEVQIEVTALDQLRRIDPNVDGVLGLNFLSRFAYLIDYKRKRLWLGAEANEQADGLPVTVAKRGSGGRTIVPVQLEPGAKPWFLTLDSGSSVLVLACDARCPVMRQVHKEHLVSFLGERSVSRGVLPQVGIGDLRRFPAEAVMVEAAPLDGQDEGVLPTRWFSAVYVDEGVVRLAR